MGPDWPTWAPWSPTRGPRRLLITQVLIVAGILICALGAPIAALSATRASARATDADQARLQNLALAEEHYSQDVATTDQDARVFGFYAELENTVIALKRQARHAALAHHRHLALALYREAQVDRSLAAGFRQGMRTTGLRPDDLHGPRFAYASALKGEVSRDAELQHAQGARNLVRGTSHAASSLFLIAAMWAAGVVFFTFAQVAGDGALRRTVLTVLGVAVALAAISFQFVVRL
jgi:hypothetical protein